MATVTKTFDYSGTLQQATIPPGTTSIDIIIWGGAGGGGGADAGGPGKEVSNGVIIVAIVSLSFGGGSCS